MLTKKQLNTLNEMLNETDIIGKNLIQKIIWMNTIKTKYKVGDKVVFSDRKFESRVCGTRVIDFVGTIVKIRFSQLSNDSTILYEIEYKLSNGETKTTLVEESEISRKTTAKNLINKVGDGETSFMLSI